MRLEKYSPGPYKSDNHLIVGVIGFLITADLYLEQMNDEILQIVF